MVSVEKIIEILKNDQYTLNELKVLHARIDAMIAEREALQARRDRIRQYRDEFIAHIVAHGRERRLDISTAQLIVAGEYIFDTEILGMSPDDIINANRDA